MDILTTRRRMNEHYIGVAEGLIPIILEEDREALLSSLDNLRRHQEILCSRAALDTSPDKKAALMNYLEKVRDSFIELFTREIGNYELWETQTDDASLRKAYRREAQLFRGKLAAWSRPITIKGALKLLDEDRSLLRSKMQRNEGAYQEAMRQAGYNGEELQAAMEIPETIFYKLLEGLIRSYGLPRKPLWFEGQETI